MIARLCNHPFCNTIINNNEKYCDLHKDMHKVYKPFEKAKRSNEGKYSDYRWKKTSKRVIERDGCCLMCGSKERLQAHHLIANELDWEDFLDDENIITVCQACHHKLTQLNIGVEH